MSLIIDGTAISVSKAIEYCPGGYLLGDTIEKVTCDGTTVWQLQKDFNAISSVPSGWTSTQTGLDSFSISSAYIGSTGYDGRKGYGYYYGPLDITPYRQVIISGYFSGDSAPYTGNPYAWVHCELIKNGSTVLKSMGVGGHAWESSGSGQDHTGIYQVSGPGTLLSKSEGYYSTSFSFSVDLSSYVGEHIFRLVYNLEFSGPNSSGGVYVTQLYFSTT